MLTAEELEARRAVIEASPDLGALLRRLQTHAQLVLERRPEIPRHKGMLSADGGFCPADGATLGFDPWSPNAHRCTKCGAIAKGERHDLRWAWYQHLWLAERMASLATVGILADDEAALTWAAEQVRAYAERYHDYPNIDNVLGPSRLFFSTYLESIWLTRYLAAAFLLREANALDEETLEGVNRLAEEAANLIGEFDEGASNRQVWHNAALAAVAVWFEDQELAQRALEGHRGLAGALADGFGADGMWYEGENYHLFALQGMLTGACWARLAGAEFFVEEQSRDRLVAALRAPIQSALPDGTFPARKDSRFGVSLAQPMYLELWENGIGGLLAAGAPGPAAEFARWLERLYALPAPPAERFDSWLEEAGEPPPDERGRQHLSWWMLLTMAPELPLAAPAAAVAGTLLEEEGLAILRYGESYASLDCGAEIGGHGHPDRLHLTLHGDGVHWLADPGTGSYVSRDLFWYRSTMAHNAPRLDGRSQPWGDARCEYFEAAERWGWARGRFAGMTRTVVSSEQVLVDVVEFSSEDEHTVELPWHPAGAIEVLTPGRWEPGQLEDPFAKGVERFVPEGAGPIRWRATESGKALSGLFDGGGELLRATAPGRPGEGERSFLVRRLRGRYVRLTTVLAWGGVGLTGATFTAESLTVETSAGALTHHPASDGWVAKQDGEETQLRGFRRPPVSLAALDVPTPGRERPRWTAPEATAFHLPDPPPLDGTLEGFATDAPLGLDHEDQYRRSEEPYPGEEAFSARAYLGWDEQRLYAAVHVTKEPLLFRSPDAPPLRLDNEPDLVHADGIQVFLTTDGAPMCGWLVAPDPRGDAVTVVPVAGTAAKPDQLTARWAATDDGYIVTLAITPQVWPPDHASAEPRFDVVVNEMRPGRQRRAGQLAWSGGGGWVYLRGDRTDPARLGRVILA